MFWYFYKGLEPYLQRAHAGHTQGWASVSLYGARGLVELRSLYEHLQARKLAGEVPF